VLTATFNSYGDRQISTPHKINTPEPIDKKIGTIDYTREGTSYTIFGRNPLSGGFWAKWVKYNKNYYLAIQRRVWRDIKFAVFCLFVRLRISQRRMVRSA